MAQEDRDRWSQKRCPFGVGDSNGMCCTSECAAWSDWVSDTRETRTITETRIEDRRPGWFSDWYVIESGVSREYKEINDEGKEQWHGGGRWYKWGKDRTVSSGQYVSGGTCKRLHPG